MKNSEDFLRTMQRLNPEIEDFEGAVTFAMSQTTKVDSDRWFGEIYDRRHGYSLCGVYYADSHESRWWADLTQKEVAVILVSEMV